MLTNKKMRELLDYDPGTGLFHWRVSRGFIRRGTLAGGLFQDYIAVTIDGKRYTGHYLAWRFIKGREPKVKIRHLNGDKTNNRANNLTDHRTKSIVADNRVDIGIEYTLYGYRVVRFFGGTTKDIGTYSTFENATEVVKGLICSM